MSKKLLCLLLVIMLAPLILLYSAACQRQSAVLNVAAATSLMNVINEINALYMKDNPSVKVIANFNSPGTLQTQIENGAPADVFISASPIQVDALQRQKLIIDSSRRDLLCNKVVLAVPVDSGREITCFNDLASSRVRKIVVGDPGSVAIGLYAQHVFNIYGITEAVKEKIVLAGSARQVLTYVESGNVDAGIVFFTDAIGSDKVRIAAYAPDEVNSTIVYPVSIIKHSQNIGAAASYEEYLFSKAATDVFEKYGFTPAKR